MNANTIYDVPCQCLRCGNIYLSGNEIIGKLLMGEYAEAWRRKRIEQHTIFPCFGGYACPLCGCNNEFHIDIIDLIEDSLKAFSKISVSDLLGLESRLKQTFNLNFTINNYEQAKSDIIQTAPELTDLKSFLPKTRQEAYALIGIILTAIGIVIGLLGTGRQSASDEKPNVTRIVNITQNNYSPLETFKNKALPIKNIHHRLHRRKIGRNDPCHCGSNKKYKNCCGKN